MTITIIIDTDNAAFADDFGGELSDVLRKLAKRAHDCSDAGDMIGVSERDVNGNTVARVFGQLQGAPRV